MTLWSFPGSAGTVTALSALNEVLVGTGCTSKLGFITGVMSFFFFFTPSFKVLITNPLLYTTGKIFLYLDGFNILTFMRQFIDCLLKVITIVKYMFSVLRKL